MNQTMLIKPKMKPLCSSRRSRSSLRVPCGFIMLRSSSSNDYLRYSILDITLFREANKPMRAARHSYPCARLVFAMPLSINGRRARIRVNFRNSREGTTRIFRLIGRSCYDVAPGARANLKLKIYSHARTCVHNLISRNSFLS